MTDANAPAGDGGYVGENGSLEDNLKRKSTWVRLVFMIAYAFIGYLTFMVAALITVLSFFVRLLTGDDNAGLQRAGAMSATYLAEIVRFQTYNGDDRPFPFGRPFPGHDD